MDIFAPISTLKGIGPAYLRKLNQFGIKTVRDLLYHIPHRYEDFSNVVKIGDLAIGGDVATVQGRIAEIKNFRSWKKKMFVTEALVEDETGGVKAIWFNQPYLTKNLRRGVLVNLSGKITLGKKSASMMSPAYEVVVGENDGGAAPGKSFKHTAGLIPVYPVTRGLTSRAMRYFIKPLLRYVDPAQDVLPPQIRKDQKLVGIKTALNQIHFPESSETAAAAKKRLAFEEMFLWQLIGLSAKRKILKSKAVSVKFDEKLARAFTASLPFRMTDSQRVSAWQIIQDISKPQPMNRLLEGDVGSGKTVVAALAALMAAKDGCQVAFMAPTEILARQHFLTLTKVLRPFDVEIGLLTASGAEEFVLGESRATSKQNLIKGIKGGFIKIAVGTHALIQKKVDFKNLVLAVVDEQHRFGVEQRAEILKSGPGTGVHLLSMTATPIPRTLALTIYGDLDISLIKELPPGRQKIVTEIVPPDGRKKTYAFIEEQVREGRQVFVICPRIEKAGGENAETGTAPAGPWSDAKAVKDEYEKLAKNIFPDLKIGMLHGKLKAGEKSEVMKKFAENRISILVSTSVVEVGVDVPNATIMMIEGADRFGLAQLYQFRGRVGRGSHQSYCFLMADSSAKAASFRLEALAKCENGFELAEKDLQLRGPGDFYGIRQSGLPDLTMASLADIFLIEASRGEAGRLLDADPELKNNPLLKARVAEFKKRIHFE